MSRKAQSEMIGLLVIVILIIFIGLVFLRLSLNKQSSLPELRTNIQANNMLSSILKYSVSDGSIRDLVVRCVVNNECDMVQKEVKTILDSVIDQRTKYEFLVVSEDKEALKIGGCDKGIAGNNQISEQGVFIDVRLKLCTVI